METKFIVSEDFTIEKFKGAPVEFKIGEEVKLFVTEEGNLEIEPVVVPVEDEIEVDDKEEGCDKKKSESEEADVEPDDEDDATDEKEDEDLDTDKMESEEDEEEDEDLDTDKMESEEDEDEELLEPIEIDDTEIVEHLLDVVSVLGEEVEIVSSDIPLVEFVKFCGSPASVCNYILSEKKVIKIVGGQKVVKDIPTVKKKRKLSAAQKAALIKARKKAHTAGAAKARAKSMKVRSRLNLDSAVIDTHNFLKEEEGNVAVNFNLLKSEYARIPNVKDIEIYKASSVDSEDFIKFEGVPERVFNFFISNNRGLALDGNNIVDINNNVIGNFF